MGAQARWGWAAAHDDHSLLSCCRFSEAGSEQQLLGSGCPLCHRTVRGGSLHPLQVQKARLAGFPLQEGVCLRLQWAVGRGVRPHPSPVLNPLGCPTQQAAFSLLSAALALREPAGMLQTRIPRLREVK